MAKLSISDDLKFGRQEILLDPTKTANKCGSEVDALIANDLMVKKSDGTYVYLIDFITQENLRIGGVEVVATGTNVTISWNGEPTDVVVKINNVDYQPTEAGKWIGVLAVGEYEVIVKATADFRGITKTFTVSEPQVGEDIVITFNGE